MKKGAFCTFEKFRTVILFALAVWVVPVVVLFLCFDYPLQDWFEFKIPKTTISPNYIYNCLNQEKKEILKGNHKIFSISSSPEISYFEKIKKGTKYEMVTFLF